MKRQVLILILIGFISQYAFGQISAEVHDSQATKKSK